ncbi:MAG: hypothetical protein Fur006_64560 [Coleofasciculaceae cyanobacterium]
MITIRGAIAIGAIAGTTREKYCPNAIAAAAIGAAKPTVIETHPVRKPTIG